MTIPPEGELVYPQYRVLAELPSSYFDLVVTCPIGDIVGRARFFAALRKDLVEGTFEPGRDPHSTSLDPELTRQLQRAVEVAGVAPLCAHDPETTDEVLLVLLRALADLELPDFEEVFRALNEDAQRGCVARGCSAPSQRELERDAAAVLAELFAGRVHDRLQSSFGARAAVWNELRELFARLGGPRGRCALSSRMTLGISLDAALALRRHLERLPPLVALLESLGRRKPSRAAPLRRGAKTSMATSHPSERGQARAGGSPLSDIVRSGKVSRVLPSEAVLLMHPVFKRLFHARRVEEGLLVYDGRELKEDPQRSDKRAPLSNGPIIVMLDTSGSMYGERLDVAKGVVAQILVSAVADNRRVFVCTFSGKGQIGQHELSLTGAGLGHALAFLARAFLGGTLLCDVLERAATKTEDWSQADLLVLTDGEVEPLSELQPAVEALERARSLNDVRLITVLVAHHGTGKTMRAISDEVHCVAGWVDASGMTHGA